MTNNLKTPKPTAGLISGGVLRNGVVVENLIFNPQTRMWSGNVIESKDPQLREGSYYAAFENGRQYKDRDHIHKWDLMLDDQ